ncbi:IS66 family insertion sequence element accessory protein TnpB, partial [Burkholderia pseudomallei]|nr:IS66 family insertion sequence element accessory protein TnpB [Burkholderia pseudomallei]
KQPRPFSKIEMARRNQAGQIEQPAPAPVGRAAPAGAIEISVGNTRVRIEGSPHAATLLLVPRMLRGTSGPTA